MHLLMIRFTPTSPGTNNQMESKLRYNSYSMEQGGATNMLPLVSINNCNMEFQLFLD